MLCMRQPSPGELSTLPQSGVPSSRASRPPQEMNTPRINCSTSFPLCCHSRLLPLLGRRLLPELQRMEVVGMLYLGSPPPCSQLHTAVVQRHSSLQHTPEHCQSSPRQLMSLETLNIITKFNAFIIARWISEKRS